MVFSPQCHVMLWLWDWDRLSQDDWMGEAYLSTSGTPSAVQGPSLPPFCAAAPLCPRGHGVPRALCAASAEVLQTRISCSVGSRCTNAPGPGAGTGGWWRLVAVGGGWGVAVGDGRGQWYDGLRAVDGGAGHGP